MKEKIDLKGIVSCLSILYSKSISQAASSKEHLNHMTGVHDSSVTWPNQLKCPSLDEN